MSVLRSRILWLAVAAAVVVWVLTRRRAPTPTVETRPAEWPPLRMAEAGRPADEADTAAVGTAAEHPSAPPAADEAEHPSAPPAADEAEHHTAPIRDVVPTEDEQMWVEPVDGVCPASHPVKAKESSGIYHLPDGAMYNRTKADRCYLSPAHAESDGFRASKT